MITLKDVQLDTFHFDDFYDEWIKEIDNEITTLNLVYHKNMPENEFVKFISDGIDLIQRKQLLQDLKKASNESKIRIDDLEGSLQMLNLCNKEPERFVEDNSMYMELMDAKDALIKAREITTKEKEDNFNRVIEPINNAINKGSTYVRCSVNEYALTSETLQMLRKKGYRIFYDKTRFGIHYFIIAWDDENRETEDHSVKELFKDINIEE